MQIEAEQARRHMQVLWLKSRNSEMWLDRRTNYTRSTAVMSMAGYVLGLGDRHPSNLMLDRYSGKLVHIDFGDCFESSMTREKYPEKVPFRCMPAACCLFLMRFWCSQSRIPFLGQLGTVEQ
jgi:phosphatidylinositol kinase/protein kinase (PI-3  family)